MTNLIFARISWHPRYDGKYPFPYTGAIWKEKKEGGYGEWLNFKEAKGKFYGYINRGVDLRKFGAKKGAKSVENINVIWVAPDPKGGSKIVGWYKNTKVYSELKERPRPLKDHYLCKVNISNCTLLSEDQRLFKIQKQFRYTWYAQDEEGKNLKKRVLKYINEGYIDRFDEYTKNIETFIESHHSKGKGQGFKITDVLKKKIENYSVSKATAYFEKLGFSVEDVGSTQPYDLKCTKGKKILRVEVKGTQTAGKNILLTPNEIKSARTHKTALYILHSILVTKKAKNYKLSGGKEMIMKPWKIEEQGNLKPISYMYYISTNSN